MQSLVLTDMDIIGIFLQNTFTGRQFVCKIQEREYLTKTSHTPNGLRTLKIQYFS